MHCHHFPVRLRGAVTVAALYLALAAPALAQQDDAAAPDAADARQAVAVLEDEARRAELLATLRAIAGASDPDPGAADGDSAAADGDAEDASPLQEVVPLQEDGLIARTQAQLGAWADRLGVQLAHAAEVATRVPHWLQSTFATAAGRRLLLQALVALALVFGAGLLLEFGLRRALRRPREALASHASEQAAREAAAARAAGPDASTIAATAAQADPVAARQAAPRADVALVQTVRDGAAEVDEVPVPPDKAAAGGPPPAPPAPGAGAGTGAKAGDGQSRRHWQALRQLPLALGALALDLLPLVLFFLGAALVLFWLQGGDMRLHDLARAFAVAYLVVRVTMALVRLVVTPAGYGLCMLREHHGLPGIVHVGVRRVVAVAAFGVALATAAELFDGGEGARMAILKASSLLAHLLVIALLFRIRRPVAGSIRPAAGADGPLVPLREWLSTAWVWLATVAVLAVWIVWAMGVDDGFPRLLRFLAVSGAILLGGRVVAVLALGALGRVFDVATGEAGEATGPGDADAAPTGRNRVAHRFYPLASRLVSITVAAATAVILLQAWGVDAVGWFAAGTIGRGLLSALATILVALAVATLVWQLANGAIERRVEEWEQAGDRIRAARLRTLMPILRTVLFVVIAVIIGLTALSEIGINTTPLLAGASIVGVAIGFGSQKLVQDFITGIFLLMENAMQVGDWITVAGVSGTVEHISVRTVRLRAGDGSLHIIPFSSVDSVNNVNRGVGNAAVLVGVGYDADIERVFEELRQIGASLHTDPAYRDLVLGDLEVWGVDSVDGSMVTIKGQMRCTDRGRWGVQREINRRILERFRALGISIADPRTRLLVPGETDPD